MLHLCGPPLAWAGRGGTALLPSTPSPWPRLCPVAELVTGALRAAGLTPETVQAVLLPVASSLSLRLAPPSGAASRPGLPGCNAQSLEKPPGFCPRGWQAPGAGEGPFLPHKHQSRSSSEPRLITLIMSLITIFMVMIRLLSAAERQGPAGLGVDRRVLGTERDGSAARQTGTWTLPCGLIPMRVRWRGAWGRVIHLPVLQLKGWLGR